MCQQKNQTPRQAFEALARHRVTEGSDEKFPGTGLFAVPDPEKSGRVKRVVAVRDITYSECVRRGELCISFKWIPTTLQSYDDLMKQRAGCSGYCNNNDDCAFGCLCDIVDEPVCY